MTMADGCDDPMQIDPLVRLVERGVVVAAASRYMRGGQQIGGPLLKSLALAAGRCPCTLLAGLAPTTPPIPSRPTRRSSSARSASSPTHGFEVGIELVAKARRRRLPVAEIPTIWLERDYGQSNFKLCEMDPALPAVVLVRLRPSHQPVESAPSRYSGSIGGQSQRS